MSSQTFQVDNNNSSKAGNLSTSYLKEKFQSLVNNADADVKNFMAENSKTVDGKSKLHLSSSDSLALQELMTTQNTATQAATSTMKSLKDVLMSALRNI